MKMSGEVLESSEVGSRHRTEDLMNACTLRVGIQCCGWQRESKGEVSERGRMEGGRGRVSEDLLLSIQSTVYSGTSNSGPSKDVDSVK